jgi:FkbM family methyltransferase
VRGWIDLGCNVGFFSLGLLDSLSAGVARRPATKALLADANRECLQTVRETLALNAIGPEWACEHVVVGPPGEVVTFNQFRYSVHSNVFPDQRGEKVFRYPATDLTALLQSRESLFDLIKIDIEGAEVFVFRHHADLLRRFRFGLCEWHAPQYSGRDLSESIDRLGGKVLEMRSHPKNYDLSRGPSWDSPLGTALWRMG